MRPLAEIDVQLVTDIDTAAECARWLSTCDHIAIDTETTGLSPERDEVRTFQIGDDDQAYVIPLEGIVYPNSNVVPGLGSGVVWNTRGSQACGWGGFAVDMLKRMSDDAAGPLIDMHNATYDHSMIKHTLGVNMPRHRIHDTRLMLHVLDSTGPLGLKKAAQRLVDPHANLGQELLDDALGKKSGWSWATVPIGFKPYWFYAGLDTIITRRLSKICLPRVMAEAPRSYELELAVSWPCEDMERKGVRLDRPYTESFHEQLAQFVEETETWCKSEYNVYPGSDAKVIELLMNDGVELVKRTATGARYSLDKEVLTGLTHPLAEAVLARRQAMHIDGYLRSYLGFAGEDDIIHPSINTVGGISKNPFESGGSGKGVRTGRMSMSEPNLQNVPKRTKESTKIRRCFIPREGNTWIKVDADQIESRILTHLSQDPNLIEAFQEAARTGGDFFVNIAKQLFHDPEFKKSDPRRQFVKNGMYAKIYGAGLPKFADTAHATLAEADAFMRSFDQTYSGVPRFINHVESVARQRLASEGEAYIRSPLTGRKHTVEARKIYPIVNYLIQGMAGEILKLKVVEAANAGLDEYMMFLVHDEADLDVPNDLVPDVLETLRKVMNDDDLLSVPITWSADTGPNWGECNE
jgi:DNA polymerase-1